MHFYRLTRFRILIIAFAAILLALLVTNYRNSSTPKEDRPTGIPVAPLTVDEEHSVSGLEYTEMKENRVLLRVQARKYVLSKDKKRTLEDIRAVHYTEDNREDRVSSDTVINDPATENTIFQGRVVIRIQEGTEISTDAFTYYKNEDVARGEGNFRFDHKCYSGKGHGFLYEFKTGTLHILKGAEFLLKDTAKRTAGEISLSAEKGAGGSKTVSRESMCIRSEQADITRDHRLLFWGGAEILQDPYLMAAKRMELEMDPTGSAIRRLVGTEDARFRFSREESKEIQNLSAFQIEMLFSETDNTPQRIVASNDASFRIVSAKESDTQLRSSQIGIDLSAAGTPIQLQTADYTEIGRSSPAEWVWIQGGALVMHFFPGRAEPMDAVYQDAARARHAAGGVFDEFWAKKLEIRFQDKPGKTAFDKILGRENTVWKRASISRQLTFQPAFTLGKLNPEISDTLSALEMTIDFQRDSESPAKVAASGGCHLESTASRGEDRLTRKISSSWMNLVFLAGKTQPDRMEAGPWVSMEERLPKENRKAFCSFLNASFNPKDGRLQHMKLEENFRMEQGEARISSQTAEYNPEKETWVLNGDVHLQDQEVLTLADAADIVRQGELFQARGGVRSIFQTQAKKGEKTPVPSFGSSNRAPFLVAADTMDADRKARTVRYRKNAKASQGNNSIRGEEIVWSQDSGDLQATGSVTTIFHQAPEPKAGGKGGSRPIEVTADRLTFSGKEKILEYFGSIALQSEELRLKAPHLKADLDDKGAGLSRVNAWEGVKLTKGNMNGNGMECVYDVVGNTLLLTGKPAVITDPSRGRSVGSRLTLTLPDDKILIES